jgi:hypothetical protein
MDELEYEPHLQRYRSLFAISAESPPENVLAAEREAQYSHALTVFNPLRDWSTNAVELSEELKDENAKFYMKYGAARRFGMMFYAYRQITLTADAKRSDPLTYGEQQDLSRDINVLYMHTRGVLDNLAWCILYERHPEIAGQISPYDVGLFSQKFRTKCPCFTEMQQDIDAHKNWNIELKARRDPVAHRIPLYIPHAQITETEKATYQRLFERYIAEAGEQRFEDADNTFARLHQVGRFVPYFLHHPGDGPIPLYPTVPSDMAHVVQIANVVQRVLRQE